MNDWLIGLLICCLVDWLKFAEDTHIHKKLVNVIYRKSLTLKGLTLKMFNINCLHTSVPVLIYSHNNLLKFVGVQIRRKTVVQCKVSSLNCTRCIDTATLKLQLNSWVLFTPILICCVFSSLYWLRLHFATKNRIGVVETTI